MAKPGHPNRTIRVPDDLWLTALAVAKGRGESLSGEIRKFLQSYIRRNK